MNQNCSTIERMLETGDGCISRKVAIANGVAPASFARYVRSHELIKIRHGVYTKKIGAIDVRLQRVIGKIRLLDEESDCRVARFEQRHSLIHA